MKTKIELTENATMLVDANVQLPNAVKNVLGALIYTSGAFTEHRKENSDWFYKDANSLIEESQVSKKTFFRAINLLEANNFIERKSGSLKNGENKVTQYKILKGFNIFLNDTNECQKSSNDTLNDTLEKPLMTHKNKELRNKNKELRNKNKELSNKNKEEILNIIINKIEDNNNNLINILKKEIKKEIENIKEKESYSSINENKETMKELINKINALQDENSKLKERLNNCARQFKQMMQENNEMKRTMKELQLKVTELEAKVNKTSTNETSTEKQEKSNSKPSIDVDCMLTHAKEEKSTVAQQMPSTTITTDNTTPKEDVDVNEVMKVFADVVKQYEEQQKEHCNECALNTFKAMILQDLDEKKVDNSKRKKVEERINNYINNYKGKTILSHSIASINQQPSTVEEERKDCAEKKEDALKAISSPTANDNDSTLTSTKEEDLKPIEAKQMPSNEKNLRYLDTATNKQYATEAEAQNDGVNPWFLYDWKVGRCILSYEDEDEASIDESSIVNQEKAVEAKENALNERESFLYTVAEVFADLRKRSYINYKDKTDQLKEVWNVILSKEDILSQEDLEVCQKELKEMLCQANVSSY